MREKTFHVNSLQSGGLITNYNCSSKCLHCLYACSSKRDRGYIEKEAAARLFRKSIAMGCRSLHIGGGEPFLNIPKLKEVLKAAHEEGMGIQYVETNSSWYRNHAEACDTLDTLQELSVSCLLISISPFHNEYIPFDKVKGVMRACNEVNMSIFPWIADFYQDIDTFSSEEVHSMSEYLETFGSDYIKKVLRKYWIHPGGRALNSFRHRYGKREAMDLLEDSTGCIELADTSHFHFDLNEQYIPGLCSGIQIQANDMGSPLDIEKYPFLHLLYNKGIKGFYHQAAQEYGFKPRQHYSSKCDLCLDIRRFLVIEKEQKTNEFGPHGFYSVLEAER